MANELSMIKKDVVDVVSGKVKEFQNSGELHFPAGYSPENAMKSAWLILQETKDRNNKPALQVCTKDSIANALLDMVVQGLNPAKKQGYFIPYGSTLTFQPSYFGAMAVTKRLTGARNIDAMTIHEGDKVTYEIVNGRYVNLKHEQDFGSTNKPIIGAYCTITEKDGSLYTEVMTFEEIKKSWKQSKMNPDGDNSTHSKFPVEMTKKTVTRRACKRFMNSSDDSSILFNLIEESEDRNAEAATRQIIEEKANGEYLDFDDAGDFVEIQEVKTSKGESVDPETAEIFTNGEAAESADDEAGF